MNEIIDGLSSTNKFNFSIDRGGTFTDVYAQLPGGSYRVLKLLSEDPSNYQDAPREGIRRILEEETGIPHPRDKLINASRIGHIRMGTTVATNALLERKGESCALIITAGFKDLLFIGNQARPNIFDLNIQKPEVLYECVQEIDEKVIIADQDDIALGDFIVGTTGDKVKVSIPLDIEKARASLQLILDRGIQNVAVVFKHAYTFSRHEEQVAEIAKELGFKHIAISSKVMPMVKMVPRGLTTCTDAYLTPITGKYIFSFFSGFDNLDASQVLFMQSDGGLTPVESFCGHRAILSGPAGGVVGYAQTTKGSEAVIGFDMGGTSTDVSRYDGKYDLVFETLTAGIPIQCPQLDISTVAAGGGSRLFFQDGLFRVGPESVGAHPGPVCYRKNGNLAVTDANVVLGRIVPELFPKIFGPKEDEPLDMELARLKFQDLTDDINASSGESKTVEEIAAGFVRIANEAMCRPIRNLTTMKGFNVAQHTLACFGGAGPQHCCAMAKALGIRKVIVTRFSGVLSAYGLSLADVVVEKQEAVTSVCTQANFTFLIEKIKVLRQQAIEELLKQGFSEENIQCPEFVNLRYHGTDTALMTPGAITTEEDSPEDLIQSFKVQYNREFGHLLEDRDVLVDDIRVRAVAKGLSQKRQQIPRSTEENPTPRPFAMKNVYFDEGWLSASFFRLEDLLAGHQVMGPAVILQDVSTVLIEPGCVATISEEGDIEIDVLNQSGKSTVGTELDPVQLSVFSHRFMGIAEQMGYTLQRTSISVNIKERLDFSCAIFDSEGGLVANAPHLPVHLGSMQEAVRAQMRYWGANLQEGDVLASNHPQLAGGVHLPDITVITPVFQDSKPLFFVASRGHHSDVGGITPGSMPPHSKTLQEEGAAIVAFKLVENAQFQEEGISEILKASGSRNLKDNIGDLRAQTAANNRGVNLMKELIEEYSLKVVQAYMAHIQKNAELAVREMLKRFSLNQGLSEVGTVEAEDFLDDGTPIQLAITINRGDGSATFDFEGTGPEVYGNLNAPPSVTMSAIIYCLRCLIPGHDIPLNQGCLVPISVNIPQGSILYASTGAAVVGGNVLTSQRVTDVILKAFKAAAASQGCMNNLTFGDKTMGYYETIAGGAGAGPSWHGCSGVHTHMTNTRITDPEILERRYPVILNKFALRPCSGGEGLFHGGDGVIRELEFRKDLTVSILSERRAFQPFGLEGGHPGARGLNLLKFADDQRTISLGGKNSVNVRKGDRLTIMTPGGGGFGEKLQNKI